jgi:hypothetical protein
MLSFYHAMKVQSPVVFAFDLMSAYEGEHMIFGLLGQANLTQNDCFHFLRAEFLEEFFVVVAW